MPVCICCLTSVEHYQEMKDGTKVCDWCIDIKRAIVKDGEVIDIKEVRLKQKKKRGRPKEEDKGDK